MTQIIKLKVENIKGVKDVEFKPNGNGVTIGGANGEGKSSTIEGLMMALGGRGKIPPEPVRKGAEKGQVFVELEDLIVMLEVESDRSSRLKVERKDGTKLTQPQTVLDKLFGSLSFDPGSFRNRDKEVRFRTLTELLKIDPSKIEAEHAKLYEERREVGRIVTEMEGKLAGRHVHLNVPENEIDASSTLEELKQLQTVNREINALKTKALECESHSERLAIRNKANFAEISRLEAQIEKLKLEIHTNENKKEEFWSEAVSLREKVAAIEATDDSQQKALRIDEQLKNYEETNRKVRENRETKKIQTNLEVYREDYNSYTQRLRALEEEKEALLTNIKAPIPGLTLRDGQVFYNGIPFEQISEAEQWEVSTAIGFALNPKGIVFMKNCGGLDRRSRERVRARAAELGVQLFLEVVDDADDVEILIEDGTVKANRLEGEQVSA